MADEEAPWIEVETELTIIEADPEDRTINFCVWEEVEAASEIIGKTRKNLTT